MCLVNSAFAFDAAGALGDHEGLEALLAQAAQDVDGGDVGVSLGAARVLALGEDGRRRGAHLVFAQGLVAAHHAVLRAKRVARVGVEYMMVSFDR